MLIIVAMMLLGRRGRMGHPVTGGPHDTPLELFQKRFVRGELTRIEYEEMKRVLLDSTSASSARRDDQ
jgi:uncharacterized membrane protein